MIADHDRSGWIGGSDTAMVIGNWKTKTWEKWWMQKIGINTLFTELSKSANINYMVINRCCVNLKVTCVNNRTACALYCKANGIRYRVINVDKFNTKFT